MTNVQFLFRSREGGNHNHLQVWYVGDDRTLVNGSRRRIGGVLRLGQGRESSVKYLDGPPVRTKGVFQCSTLVILKHVGKPPSYRSS